MRVSTSTAVRPLGMRSKAPRGFTMIELLVAISIIVLLMSLILPAVQNSRQAARRVECQNHLRSVALAALNYATSQRQFPTLHSRMDVDRGSGPQSEWFPWPVTLLPHLDQVALFESWSTNPQPDFSLKVFTCPSDYSNWQQPGGLSYVVNCGYGVYTACCVLCNSMDTASVYSTGPTGSGAATGTLTTKILDDVRTSGGFSGITISVNQDPPNLAWDWNLDGQLTIADHLLFKASGVIWNPVDGLAIQNSIDDISRGDGSSQTLLMAENTKARRWGAVSSLWVPGPSGDLVVSPELSTMSARFLAVARHKGFGISTEVFRDANNEHLFPGTGYKTVPQAAALMTFDNVSESPGAQPRCGRPPMPPFKPHPAFINSGKSFDPNSNHHGGAYVAFCDGHLQFLSEQINVNVYARMLSSDGARYGQTPE